MSALVTRAAGDDQSTRTAAGAAPTVIPRRPGTWVLRWLPAATTVAVTIAVLLAQHTAPSDIARYGLYVVWALMLPGTLIYRSLRRIPHSLVDDLAMGTAVGFAVEIAAWAAYAAAGMQDYLWTWPGFVVALFLAIPGLRRHWRTPAGYRSTPLGWSWTVAGIALALVAYLAATLLYAVPVPRTGEQWYYLDNTYLLGLVGDALHHFPLHSPQVASEPLHYHWFTYAHMASASLVSGVDAPVVYFRFALPVICTAAVVLMAVVGWRVSGRPWVGALAAALMFVAAEFTASDYVMFGMIGRWMIVNSPSMAYAWLSTFPLVLIGVDRLRRGGLPDAPLGRGAWALLVLFAAAAAGAKSTILLVVLAGIAMAGLVALVRRQVTVNLVATGLVVVLVVAASMVVLYGGQSGGLELSPLNILRFYIPGTARSTVNELAVLSFMGGAYVLYMLPRLAGIPVLAWLSRRRRGDSGPTWTTTEWYLFGAIAAGIAGTLLLGHITSAQVYLIRSAWPFGAILSALGLAALVERYRVPRKVVAGIAAGAVAATTVIVYILSRTRLAVPGTGSRFVLPIYWAALVTVVVCAVIGVTWFVVARRTSLRRGIGAVSILALVLAMGMSVGLREIYQTARAGYVENRYYTERVTPDGIAMTDWVKANVPPDALLATNAHCPAGDPKPNGPCLYLTSWLSAFAERRFLVGGWGYAGTSALQAAKRHAWIGTVPFFDPPKLAANEAAFYRPTAGGLADLRDRYGVGWLVVDRSVGPESADLRQLASPRFDRGDYAVYELR